MPPSKKNVTLGQLRVGIFVLIAIAVLIFLVLNAVAPDIYLTVHLERRPWLAIFSRAAGAGFDEYCDTLAAALRTVPGMGAVRWERLGS